MTEKKSTSRKTKSGAAKKATSGTGTKKSAGRKKTATRKKTGADSQKKTRTRRSKTQKTQAWGLKWDLLVFVAIVAMVAATAAYYRFELRPDQTKGAGVESTRAARAPEPVKVLHPQTVKEDRVPDFEVFPPEPDSAPAVEPEQAPVAPPSAQSPDRRPMVAIIIDDMGYEMEMAENFLSLDCSLTYSVLPQSPFQREIAESAHNKGCQVMLHLPMEPQEYPEVDPGPGALLTGMSTDERIGLLKSHLNAVPHISGVNNHMGSKMSADSAQMNQVLSIVKKYRLFYIDSLTAADSRSGSSARLFQVPFARRDVFLDHVPEADFIRGQLDRLVALARKNGKAVGIGHPYPETYQVLSEKLPEIKKQVRLVPASEIVSGRDS
ncbi:MAG: divergent polysaccharide deacetylase family protein [Desulfobacterales bacterium]|nr:divergent polysaccharide deacetylase family protein [Desulfobacterales bacterium]